MREGMCGCGAIRFSTPDEAVYRTICHCADCRRQSGAPFLAWAMYASETVQVRGEPRVFESSASGRRAFCADCGTGLFFTNEALESAGMMQVRIAAFDEPDRAPPLAQVQRADRLAWIDDLHALALFDRFPG